MSYGTFTLTGDFSLYGGPPASGTVIINGVPESIVDSAGKVIFVGPQVVTLDATGRFSVTLPTDVTSGTSTHFGYQVTTNLRGESAVDSGQWYARAAGSTVDLATLTPQVVEPVGDTTANRIAAQAAQTAAETAAAAAAASAASASSATSPLAINAGTYAHTSAGMQSAVNAAAAAGLPCLVPGGTTMTLTTPVALASGAHLILEAGAVLRHTATSGAALTAIGSEGSTVALTANTVTGSRTVTATGHGLVAGDLFRLGSTTVFDASSTSSTIGELLRVDSVSGATITTQTPIIGGPYTTAASATVSKITPVQDIVIEGAGAIVGNQTSNTTGQYGIQVQYGVNVHVRGITTRNIDQRHMFFRDCLRCSVTRCTFDWAVHATQAYGTSWSDACQDCWTTDNRFRNVRHSFTTNNTSSGKGIPRRLLFARNLVEWTSTALGGSGAGGDAIDTHTAAEDIWVEHNTVLGSSGQGINFECASGRIVGNLVIDSADNGIAVHNESDQPGRIRVTGNDVVSPASAGITVFTGIRGTTAVYDQAVVSGNTVRGTSGTNYSYRLGQTGPAAASTGTVFTDNTAIDCAATALVSIANVNGLTYSPVNDVRSSGTVTVADAGDDPGLFAKSLVSDTITITPEVTYLVVGSEGSASTDTLSTINGGRRGQILTVRTSSNAQDITVGSAGNIRVVGSTFVLDSSRDALTLVNLDGTTWVETARADFPSA